MITYWELDLKQKLQFTFEYIRRMKIKLSLLILLVLCFYTHGLAKRKKNPSKPLVSGQYEFVSYKKSNLIPLGPNYMTKVDIDLEKRQITINVGCNTISSQFITKGFLIEPLKLISTEMYCQDKAEYEQFVVDNLLKVNNYRFTHQVLYLRQNEKIVLALKPKK